MAALTTEQLDCLLDCTIDNIVQVFGARPADCVPSRAEVDTKHHSCFILNTHPSNQPGEHWLAFFFNRGTQRLEYFDSFGFPITMYANVNAALEASPWLPVCMSANTTGMLQSLTSTVCGHYCVAFLFWRAKHLNESCERFAQNVKFLHPNAANSDKFIVETLHLITNKHPCCASLLSSNHALTHKHTLTSQSCCCRTNCHTV